MSLDSIYDVVIGQLPVAATPMHFPKLCTVRLLTSLINIEHVLSSYTALTKTQWLF